MHDTPPRSPDGLPDPGPPLPELVGLRESPPPGFLDRLRRRLARREAAGQVVEFSLVALLRSWWSLLALLFEAGAHRPSPPPEEGDHE